MKIAAVLALAKKLLVSSKLHSVLGMKFAAVLALAKKLPYSNIIPLVVVICKLGALHGTFPMIKFQGLFRTGKVEMPTGYLPRRDSKIRWFFG